jgi:hypothetical protein
VSAQDRPWRVVGFLLLVLGFGFRLDTAWQGLAWLLLLGGAAVTGRGLWLLWQRDARPDDAFVRQAGKR